MREEVFFKLFAPNSDCIKNGQNFRVGDARIAIIVALPVGEFSVIYKEIINKAAGFGQFIKYLDHGLSAKRNRFSWSNLYFISLFSTTFSISDWSYSLLNCGAANGLTFESGEISFLSKFDLPALTAFSLFCRIVQISQLDSERAERASRQSNNRLVEPMRRFAKQTCFVCGIRSC